MDGEQLEILKQLTASVMPLGVLTFVVLSVILFGITTATESAAIGALGALYLAGDGEVPAPGVVVDADRRHLRRGLAMIRGAWDRTDLFDHFITRPGLRLHRRDLRRAPWCRGSGTCALRPSSARTSSRPPSSPRRPRDGLLAVVGSALFSAVFALHGGQSLIERWVLAMNLSPLGFLIIAQLSHLPAGLAAGVDGDHRDSSCPIFIPLLTHFQIDPILFGTMVAVNLQAAFLSPPVAMSAFYLKEWPPST